MSKKIVKDVTCLANGDGVRFLLEDGTEAILPVSYIVPYQEIPVRAFLDMSMSAAILSLHERVERLERLEKMRMRDE